MLLEKFKSIYKGLYEPLYDRFDDQIEYVFRVDYSPFTVLGKQAVMLREFEINLKIQYRKSRDLEKI